MYKLLGSFLIASLLLSACNSGSRRSRAATPPVSLPGITAAPGTQTAMPAATNPSTVITPGSSNAAAVTPSTAAVTPTTAAGTNPPHGQPGHRCDVAVGAPLGGKAAPAVTLPTSTAQPQPAAITPTPAATITPAPAPATAAVAKGTNPAHGQPGHRCDIAVGAPLDSKPGTGMSAPAATQPAPSATVLPTPAATTPAPALTTPASASGARVNPPHGQPGHDCSVQVGQPLPAKQ